MQNFLTTDVSLLMANILFLSPYVDKSQKAVVKSVGHTACLEAGLILSFGEIKSLAGIFSLTCKYWCFSNKSFSFLTKTDTS